MNQQIQNKKNIQLTHLLQSVKTHKHQYLRRPLSIATTPVYLSSAAYLSQLIPTYLSHYHHILKQQQVSSLTSDLIILFQDIMAKLKSTTDKLQAKQAEPVIYKQSEIQKMANKRQSQKLNQTTYQSQTVQSNDIKYIRVKEQIETFTPQQNKIFFQELKEALQKKQEVLAICHSQSLQYADFLDQQIHDILSLKQSLIIKEQKQGQNVNGEQLKKQVSNSLKQQWRKKIPDITKLVGHKILKSLQQRRKLNNINMAVQTQDVQNVKITQFKRKITHLQKMIQDEKTENQKLKSECQQKQILYKKIEAELQQMKEQYHKKQYDMHKSINNLEEVNRRQKQQYSKQKSRKNLTEKEMTDYPLKSVKTLRQLHEQNETKAEVQKDVALQPEQRSSKKKKTIISVNKSAKYLLSTMKKIDSKQFYQTSKTQLSENNMLLQTPRTERLNETIMAQIQNQTNNKGSKQKKQKNLNENYTPPKQSKEKQKQNKESEGKNQLLKIRSSKNKKNPGQPKIIQNKIKKVSKNAKIAERLSPFNKKQKSNFSKKQEIRLPSINKNRNQIQNLQSSNITYNYDDDYATKKMTGRFFQGDTNTQQENSINQACQQVPSNVTLKSIVSLMGKNINSREKIIKRQLQATSREQKAERYTQPHPQFQQRHISFQNSNLTDRVKSSDTNNKQQQTLNHYQSQQTTTNWQKKNYLLDTNFQRINQEIEKQNYVTPAVGIESPGLAVNRRVMTQQSQNKENYHQMEELKMCLKLLISEFSNSTQGKLDVSKLKKLLQQMKKMKDSQLTSCERQPRQTISNTNGIDSNQSNLRIKESNTKSYENTSRNKNGLSKLLKKSLTEGADIKINHPKISYLCKQVRTPQMYPNIQFSALQQRGSYPQRKIPEKNSGKQEPSLNYTNMLFLDEQMAFKYQSGFSRKINKKTRMLREEIQSFGQQLVKILQQLRIVNRGIYEKVCRQLRYPFSNGHKNCLQIQIVSGMSSTVVKQCLQILAALHRNCQSQGSNCEHFHLFKRRLEEQVILNKQV